MIRQLTKARLFDLLVKAYVFKETADYETGPEAIAPREHAAAGIDTAAQLIDCVSGVVAAPKARSRQSGDKPRLITPHERGVFLFLMPTCDRNFPR